MPHLTLDYSGNLRDTGRLDVLCATLARTLVTFEADGKRVYPVGGVRVRALRGRPLVHRRRPRGRGVRARAGLHGGGPERGDAGRRPATRCSP